MQKQLSRGVQQKIALKNFEKFTGNTCARMPKACNVIKKETLAKVFSSVFCKISKNSSFTEHLWTTTSDDADLEQLDAEIDQNWTYYRFYHSAVICFLVLWKYDWGALFLPDYSGKVVAEEDISDRYEHFVSKGMRYFQEHYLKAVRSWNSRFKKFSTISTRIVMRPDEIYDNNFNVMMWHPTWLLLRLG